MANSRNSPRAEVSEVVASVHAALAAALVNHLSDGAKLAIALSGGIDSMVLLDAAYALAPEQRLALSAIHVHHGLSPNADRWATFCVSPGPHPIRNCGPSHCAAIFAWRRAAIVAR